MLSSIKIRSCKTLAIIGNGFDRAHHYNTDYRSFTKCTSSPALDKFRSHCKNEGSIETWDDFENNIRILTEKLFLESYSDDHDYDANRKDVEELQSTFREIHFLLADYLKYEIDKHPLEKKASIEKYLNADTVAINFNYTNTAEAYTKNVFHVHGSLTEGDILLGYDYRDEPCLAEYKDMCWSKSICREALLFRRYLRKRRFFLNERKRKELLSAFEDYQHWDNSGRGLDEEVITSIPSYRYIDRFIKRHRKKLRFRGVNFRKIRTLAVLGHGIEADRVYLDSIISECKNLHEIILYRYHGESDDSIEAKAEFLRKYCENVKITKY